MSFSKCNVCYDILVPDTLVDLHIKLLRRVKKSVHVDKWEKAILKFCHLYSIPESWELEHYGYKGISIKLKLRILKVIIMYYTYF